MKTVYALIRLIPIIISGIMNYSYAGILAGSTRIIYPEKDHEKSLMLANTNTYPVLAQVWTDDGSGSSEFKAAPFAVLPTVFRLNPNEIKAVRIIYNGMKLPEDRESIFWLNLYEIPAVKKEALSMDYLNLAMNTQMKIFFRPKALQPLSLEEQQKQLKVNLRQDGYSWHVHVQNPSPYYINIINFQIMNHGAASALSHSAGNMLAPFASKKYQIENSQFKESAPSTLNYSLLDDYGNAHTYTVPIKQALD